MTNEELDLKVDRLIKKYSEIEEIKITYYGSADGFDSYDVHPYSVDEDDIDEVFWHFIDSVGSNFNNEGSSGNVTINLKSRTISIDDYYHEIVKELNTSIEYISKDVVKENINSINETLNKLEELTKKQEDDRSR